MPLPKHGKTAKKTMKLVWDYPIFGVEKIKIFNKSDTVAEAAKKALIRSEAFIDIAKGDKRPMLVLRECKLCNGTDKALLSSYESNEDILLMAKWFHCVKLPIDVLEKNHSYHNLFSEKHPPHLFVSRWDGSDHIPLKGDLSRVELVENLYEILDKTYKDKAKPRIKKLKKILYQYDMLDERIERLEITIDDELESKGPRSKKLKKYREQLRKAEKEMKNLKEEELKLLDMELRKDLTTK
tara:strand:+ start:1142 stop:1861 length:720 start_codon:yes stop_codon:yes gene_type:complete